MAFPGRGTATVPVIKLELDDSDSEAAPEAARPQHNPTRPQSQHNHAEAEATSPTDRVMKLTSQQCDELLEKGSLKFCEGCPVLYGFRRDGQAIEVREGVVRSAFVNIDRRRFEYEIERPTAAANEEPALDRAIEHRVAYANGCPIWIKPNETSGDEERVEARVLFARPKEEAGEMSIEYIVQYSGDESNGVLRMEEGVAADRVSCNTDAVGSMNHQRIGRRARDDNGGLEGDGRQDPIAQDQDEQRPPPVVVPDILPSRSPKKSRWGTNGEASDGVGRAIQPTKRSDERGTAVEEKDEHGGRRSTHRSGDRHPAADENGILVRGEKPAPSIERNSLLRADDDGETSALTCELSDSPAGRARAAGVAGRRSFNAAGAARTRADPPPPPSPPPPPPLSPPPPPPSAPSPFEYRKIKFQPPDPLRRQNSTASYEDAPARKQGAEATVSTGMEPLNAPLEKKTSADSSLSLSLVKQSKHGEGLWCEVTVPLWMNYGAKDLFRHLAGVEEDGRVGHKTRRICDETGCSIHLSRCYPQNGVPLVITIKMDTQYGRACQPEDVKRAMTMLEDSLLDFHGQRSAHKRLRFEMRSGARGNVLPPRSKGGAVKVYTSRWERLLELSCVDCRGMFVRKGGWKYLSKDLTKRVADATGCHIKVCAGDDECPLTLCAPYVLVQGGDSEQVERAAVMVATASHSKHEQDQFNPDTSDAEEMDSTDQIRSRKINFDLPGHLKRQNSATLDKASSGKRNAASSSQALNKQFERPKKLAKIDQAVSRGSTKDKKPVGDRLTCVLTVPLWLNYGCNDLFFHIAGKQEGGKFGHRLKKIHAETGCAVRLSRCNPKDGVPMVITIKEDTTRENPICCDMHEALKRVEDLLFNFFRESSMNGRLKIELRSRAIGNFLPPLSEGGSVSMGSYTWAQLQELNCVRPGGIVLKTDKTMDICGNLKKSIWDVTACTAELYANNPNRRLKSCKPYILVKGKEPDQVDIAAAMITKAQQNSQRKNHLDCEDEGAATGEVDSQGSKVWAL